VKCAQTCRCYATVEVEMVAWFDPDEETPSEVKRRVRDDVVEYLRETKDYLPVVRVECKCLDDVECRRGG